MTDNISLPGADWSAMTASYDDRALRSARRSIVADLHVVRGTGGNLELPVGPCSDMVQRFQSLVESDPSEVIIAGDLLHSYRTVPRSVESTVAGLKSACQAVGHACSRRRVTTTRCSTACGTVRPYDVSRRRRRLHGHEAPDVDAERYVVGHDHPTISIEGQRQPCYLVGSGQSRGSDVRDAPVVAAERRRGGQRDAFQRTFSPRSLLMPTDYSRISRTGSRRCRSRRWVSPAMLLRYSI